VWLQHAAHQCRQRFDVARMPLDREYLEHIRVAVVAVLKAAEALFDAEVRRLAVDAEIHDATERDLRPTLAVIEGKRR